MSNTQVGSRKLLLGGSMAQSQINALTRRVVALNKQIECNREYIVSLEKKLVEKNNIIYQLKNNIDVKVKDYSDNFEVNNITW